MLVYDRNGNGIIDNGRELFGDSILDSQGERFANGFEALHAFDSNGDHFIDTKDLQFQDLRLWFDRNGNGISEPQELHTLAERNVDSISLDYFEYDKDKTALRDQYRYVSSFTGPESCPSTGCPVVDVYFLVNQTLNSYIDVEPHRSR